MKRLTLHVPLPSETPVQMMEFTTFQDVWHCSLEIIVSEAFRSTSLNEVLAIHDR